LTPKRKKNLESGDGGIKGSTATPHPDGKSAALLRLEHVCKHYDSPAGLPSIQVLRDISLEVTRGESIAIAGPSGSGKSTLLNIIGSLDRPSSGRVLLDGMNLPVMPEKMLAELRNRRIGFIFQLHHLLPQCTIMENVLVPTLAADKSDRKNDRSRQENIARAKQLLSRVGISARMLHRPGQVSVGECQRAAVARALINKPGLILADEPTGSLDEAAAVNLTDLLLELNREEGTTLIIVTHSTALAHRMDRLFTLRNGELEENGK
jgi:lipoprotein-releasing system ATP-binding protein